MVARSTSRSFHISRKSRPKNGSSREKGRRDHPEEPGMSRRPALIYESRLVRGSFSKVCVGSNTIQMRLKQCVTSAYLSLKNG